MTIDEIIVLKTEIATLEKQLQSKKADLETELFMLFMTMIKKLDV